MSARMAGYGYHPHTPRTAVEFAWRAIERQETATRCRWWDQNGDAWHQKNRLYTTGQCLDESWSAWSRAIAAGITL